MSRAVSNRQQADSVMGSTKQPDVWPQRFRRGSTLRARSLAAGSTVGSYARQRALFAP